MIEEVKVERKFYLVVPNTRSLKKTKGSGLVVPQLEALKQFDSISVVITSSLDEINPADLSFAVIIVPKKLRADWVSKIENLKQNNFVRFITLKEHLRDSFNAFEKLRGTIAELRDLATLQT